MPDSGDSADLAQLHEVAARFDAELVIIGAAALLRYLELPLFTADIDLVVALELDVFAKFSNELKALRWKQEKGKGHRWRGPAGAIFDLVPAGPALPHCGRNHLAGE